MTNVETARRDITTARCRPLGVYWGRGKDEMIVENICKCVQRQCMSSTKGLPFVGAEVAGVYKTTAT
jgi:hypothetical protein